MIAVTFFFGGGGGRKGWEVNNGMELREMVKEDER
jgi:hypothetical protein